MKSYAFAIAALAAGTLAANANAQNRNKPPRPDPQTIVVEMIADYDADGNDALNAEELKAAFEGVRVKHQAERRGVADEDLEDNDAPPPPPPPGRGMGPRGGRRLMDPANMTAQLVSDFDVNDDASLDSEELLKAISFLHENRPVGPGGRRGAPPADCPQAPATGDES